VNLATINLPDSIILGTASSAATDAYNALVRVGIDDPHTILNYSYAYTRGSDYKFTIQSKQSPNYYGSFTVEYTIPTNSFVVPYTVLNNDQSGE
jgi:hypothetical protein